ncbi:MAG: hypothetical protein DRN04_12765 [Thermoprotei archaeon]|nr:MAG: hypothetical protein DRN04_12765 [Thermoprotei archaeon]
MHIKGILYISENKESNRVKEFLRRYRIFIEKEVFSEQVVAINGKILKTPVLVAENKIYVGFKAIRNYIIQLKEKEILRAITVLIKSSKGSMITIDSKRIIRYLGWSSAANKLLVAKVLKKYLAMNTCVEVKKDNTKLKFIILNKNSLKVKPL